jgi:hypothetical protein
MAQDFSTSQLGTFIILFLLIVGILSNQDEKFSGQMIFRMNIAGLCTK